MLRKNMDNEIKFYDMSEIKDKIIYIGNIDNEILSLRERLRLLRSKKNETSDIVKNFMQVNDLSSCKIASETDTSVDRVDYNPRREQKSRVSVSTIKDLLVHFFDDINNNEFIKLRSEEKRDAIFEYIENKRTVNYSDKFSVRKKKK